MSKKYFYNLTLCSTYFLVLATNWICYAFQPAFGCCAQPKVVRNIYFDCFRFFLLFHLFSSLQTKKGSSSPIKAIVWLNRYLDSHHSLGGMELAHIFHLYLIFLQKQAMTSLQGMVWFYMFICLMFGWP